MIKTHLLASVYHEGYTGISRTGTFDSKNAYALAKKKNAEITIEITVKNTANNIFLYFNNLYPIKANTVAITVQ